MSNFPNNNRTWQILQAAEQGNYAVGAFNCYNTEGILAVIRAAEKCRSPAIIQLFPWSLHFHGRAFIDFVVAAAHGASVPISVHLDHCIKHEDIEFALTMPFDSIMVDGSIHGDAENTAFVRGVVKRARERNITIEAELGRIEGGEDGVPTMELEAVMTDPGRAEKFVENSGVQFLAPAFGNVHGGYPKESGGPERFWDLERLAQIRKVLSIRVPLVLHGTHPASDELVRKVIGIGVRKINMNRHVRDGYSKFVAENSGKLELTQLQIQGVEVYTRDVVRVMEEVLGSSGRA